MNRQFFRESDLLFTFSKDWVVKKYDSHAYFKILSGHGLKGVDFIGIFENRALYLIEVKNYNKRSYSPAAPDWTDIEGSAYPLALALNCKIEDSLRLIKVVNKYLTRQWWFLSSTWLRKLFNRNKLKKDWHFWQRVGEILENDRFVFPVLYLELSPDFLKQTNQVCKDVVNNIQKEYALLKSLPTASLEIISIEENYKENILKGMEVEFLDREQTNS